MPVQAVRHSSLHVIVCILLAITVSFGVIAGTPARAIAVTISSYQPAPPQPPQPPNKPPSKPSKSKASTPKKCHGKVALHGRKYLYKPETHKRVGELIVRTTKARHGTLCAVVNLLGKYRGLPKKQRRYTGVYICPGTKDHCTGWGPNPGDYGPFAHQAGPVQLDHVNGRRLIVFGYSMPANYHWPQPQSEARIHTKGRKVV